MGTILNASKQRIVIGVVISFFICNCVISQDCDVIQTDVAPCSGKLLYEHCSFKKYYKSSYVEFIKDYIKNNYPNTENDVVFSNSSLLPLKCKISSPEIQIFESKINRTNIKIEFYFSQHNLIFGDDSLLNNYNMAANLALEDSMNSSIIGQVPQDSRVKFEQLDSIFVIKGSQKKQINIAKINSKIININRTYLTNGYRPIEVYYSHKRDKIYCYLYFLEWDTKYPYDSPNSSKPIVGVSDVLKLIIDPSNGNTNFIFCPHKYFFWFGWDDCPNFWPF